MKRALVLGEAFYPEDFIINDLVLEWKKDGYEIEILTNTPSYPFGKVYKGYKNKIYQQTEFNGLKIHRFPIISGYEKSAIVKVLNYLCFSLFSTIIILFIGKRFDRIFVYHTGPLTLAIAAVIAKKLFKTPVTIWTQDLWPDSVYAYGIRKTKFLKFFLDGLVKFIYTNCKTVLVSCEGFIDKLKIYVPSQEIYYIPNWPLIDEVAKSDILLSGKFNFTFTGNIGKMQNLENIILGFNLHTKQFPDSHLNIVGSGSNLNSLKELVSIHTIKNVIFVGRKPLEEMPAYFKASNVLIISLIDKPIYEITVPSKFQTYLTACKPIFGVIAGEVKKIIEKNNIGLTATPSDLNNIADGFSKFRNMKDSDLKEISTNASILLKTHFLREPSISKLTKLFWT